MTNDNVVTHLYFFLFTYKALFGIRFGSLLIDLATVVVLDLT